jgi:hypothetical protein
MPPSTILQIQAPINRCAGAGPNSFDNQNTMLAA